MTQLHNDDKLNYEEFVNTLRRTNAELLAACETLAEDCRMALSGDWDKSDEGFKDSLTLLEDVIAKAKPHTSCVLTKLITVTIEGGLVQDVKGVPNGYELHVEDHDEGDESFPAWDAEKKCFVTIYQGYAP